MRENYRGLVLPAAAGMLIAVAALLALGPLAALDELADADTLAPEVGAALVFVLGVAVLGLVDDLLGGRRAGRRARPTRRPRAGCAATRARPRAGDFSTGVLKAVGALGLALYVLAGDGPLGGRVPGRRRRCWCSRTNLFNLLDLRPGRAGKAFVAARRRC